MLVLSGFHEDILLVHCLVHLLGERVIELSEYLDFKYLGILIAGTILIVSPWILEFETFIIGFLVQTLFFNNYFMSQTLLKFAEEATWRRIV